MQSPTLLFLVGRDQLASKSIVNVLQLQRSNLKFRIHDFTHMTNNFIMRNLADAEEQGETDDDELVHWRVEDRKL